MASASSTAPQETWRGLRVAPEERCTRYDSDDYRYSQRVEDDIIADLGGIYSPYTGEWFDTKREDATLVSGACGAGEARVGLERGG